MDFGTLFTKVLVIATMLGNILFVVLMIAHVAAKPLFGRVMAWVGERALWLGLYISGGATIGSILYSAVVGYPACILCWTQRIFIYPLPFLFALALWRKDRSIIPYALLLSLLGGAVALYQWIKDMLAWHTSWTLACPAVPGLPSCDKMYVMEFGYVTIPMIALNAFLFLIVVLYAAIRTERSKA